MLRMTGGSPDSYHLMHITRPTRTRSREDGRMDQDRARSLLIAERDEVRDLLKETETAGQADREAEDETESEDEGDAALGLTEEGEDDAIAESLRDRLDAIDRALRRLDDGTYGRSVRSGQPIPDERLEADPAAELTVEEARAAERD
jgi:DnaK suppressor protein